MEKKRKLKIIIIIVLMIAITTMSLGYAIFSATLNISSNATVTPNSSDFSIGFYESNTATVAGESTPDGIGFTSSGGATGTIPTIDVTKKSLSGAKANFTAPGQSVTFNLFIGNLGEYDAYLRAVNFLNVVGTDTHIVCTPDKGTSSTLVKSACDAISMSVTIGTTTITETNTSISRFIIPKSTFIKTSVTIYYDSGGAPADGPFSVDFGEISLDFSTMDNIVTTTYKEGDIISFEVENDTYNAEYGMTWAEWIDSDYAPSGYRASSTGYVGSPYLVTYNDAEPTNVETDCPKHSEDIIPDYKYYIYESLSLLD